jgi:hypothetical protein
MTQSIYPPLYAEAIMLKKLLIILLALMLNHCTSRRLINPADPESAGWQELNKNQGKAQVTLNDNRKISAIRLHVRADSTAWVNVMNDQSQTVATTEIKMIRFKKSGRGTLQGLGIGILTGAALGAIIGFAAGDDPPCKPVSNDFLGIGQGLCDAFRMSAAEKAAAGAIIGGAAGALVGVTTGALVGSKDKYRFQASDN